MALVSSRQSSSDPLDMAGRTSVIRKWAPVAAVVLLASGAYVAMAYVTGVMGIPTDDDWAYSRIERTFDATGHLHLIGWNEVSLIGQLFWTLPFMAVFGSSLEVLHWSNILAGAIGLFASYSVFRHFLRAGPALLGTALLALVPAYGYFAVTYMTDTVAFAAQMVCLALGLSALESRGSRRRVLLLCSVAAGLFGFTVRETAILAPVAVLASHFMVARRDERRTVAVIGASLVTLAAAFLVWRRALLGSSSYSTHLEPTSVSHVAVVVGQAYFLLAFSLLPGLIASARIRSKGVMAIGTGCAVLAAAVVVIQQHRHGTSLDLTYPVQYFWVRSGADLYGGVDALKPVFLPNALWAVTTAMILAGGILLAIALADAAKGWRTFDSGIRLIASFGLLYAAILPVRIAQNAPVDQRHLVPLAVPLLVLALWHVRSLRSLTGRLAFATAAIVGILVALSVLNAKYFDSRQWSLGKDAVTLGTRAQAVNAGFAWAGLYSPRISTKFPNNDPLGRGWKKPVPWYARLFPDSGNCMLVSRSRLDQRALEPVAVRTYILLPGVERRVWLYRNARACDTADTRDRRGPGR